MTTPPSAPYGRLTGRWTDPTGAPARGVVRIAPDPDYVAVTLHDGRAMVVRTATVKLDDTGALAADVVAPGDGVVPAGPWTYTVSVSLSGGWTRTVKAQAVQGQSIDLVAVMGTPGNPGAADLSARLAALEACVNGGAGGSGIAGPKRVRSAITTPRYLLSIHCYLSICSTARKASCGISTRPTCFMRFLPSFCFSNSFFLRETSPP